VSEQVAQATGSTVPRSRVEPLSAASFRVELTASAELRQKLELAQNLLSHAVSTGDLASLFERAGVLGRGHDMFRSTSFE